MWSCWINNSEHHKGINVVYCAMFFAADEFCIDRPMSHPGKTAERESVLRHLVALFRVLFQNHGWDRGNSESIVGGSRSLPNRSWIYYFGSVHQGKIACRVSMLWLLSALFKGFSFWDSCGAVSIGYTSDSASRIGPSQGHFNKMVELHWSLLREANEWVFCNIWLCCLEFHETVLDLAGNWSHNIACVCAICQL